MTVIHYAGVSKNKASGVSVIVPEIVKAQCAFMNVCFYNYGSESFPLEKSVVYFNKKDNDDYHSFPKPFNKPDLVVFHSPFGIPKAIRIAKKLVNDEIPYVVVPHGCFCKAALEKKRIKKYFAINVFFKKMFFYASAIQFLSLGEQTVSKYKDKAIIIPNGITIKDNEKKIIHQTKIHMTYIGRKNIYHKGLDLFINACGLVKDRIREQVIVHIYGPCEKRQNTDILELISSNGVEDFVFDCTPVFDKEKEDILRDTDVFVLTSRFEGLPGAVLEAWSYGCPTLLSVGTNMAEEAILGGCGWKVNNDVYDIADTIIQICDKREEINIKSKNAFKFIRNYNWSNIAKLYYNMYKKIIDL